tara:strand:- start:278 stop:478 length:201 start_codon:yes stop_codon:yes gene_type:complete
MKKNKIEYFKYFFIAKRWNNNFSFNDTIINDPYLDETERFEVDPLKYYGVDEEWLKEYNKRNGKQL